jgi:tetratricopeptide (TPR) repeat protein
VAEGRRLLEQALRVGAAADRGLRSEALKRATQLAAREGNPAAAEALGAEALTLARSSGEPAAIAASLHVLGIASGWRGDFEQAEAHWREALDVWPEGIHNRRGRATLSMLGWVGLARRDYPSARAHIERALALCRQAGDQGGICGNLSNLGALAVREGRAREALEPLRESLPLAHDELGVDGLAYQLVDLAAAFAALGWSEQAAVMLGGAEALLEQAEGDADAEAAEWRGEVDARVRRNLAAATHAALWERGRKMTVDELIRYALELLTEEPLTR